MGMLNDTVPSDYEKGATEEELQLLSEPLSNQKQQLTQQQSVQTDISDDNNNGIQDRATASPEPLITHDGTDPVAPDWMNRDHDGLRRSARLQKNINP